MIFVDNKLSAICLAGGEAKGILIWDYCIFEKVGTENGCSNILFLIENRYCRDLKEAQTKAENRVPSFPNLTWFISSCPKNSCGI